MSGKSHRYGDFNSVRDNPTSPMVPLQSTGRGCLGSFALGCGVTLAVLFVCGGGALWLWPSFVRYGVDSDLARVERLVGTAEIEEEERAVLLERVAALRTTARGKQIEFVEWMSLNDQLDSIAADERVDPAEVPALTRELDRLEADFSGR